MALSLDGELHFHDTIDSDGFANTIHVNNFFSEDTVTIIELESDLTGRIVVTDHVHWVIKFWFPGNIHWNSFGVV